MIAHSRRAFMHRLGVSAAGAAALCGLGLSPRSAFAGVTNADLKFVFYFNSGGWDPLTVFAPLFGSEDIEMAEGDSELQIGGLRIVDSAERPSVRRFFEEHHERTAVLNGVSVRSLSHEVCRSICLTGTSSGQEPEWAELLNSARGAGSNEPQQGETVLEALRGGVGRSVTISPAVSWDTHRDNVQQSALFETLFSDLGQLVERLANTPGDVGASLADETVLVVMSEMGRTPRFNGRQGRDHWPYTSLMLMGPGINGSRTYGGFDDQFRGVPIDLELGTPDREGVLLTAGGVGATLVALAGGDPSTALPGQPAIRGLLA